MTAEMKDRMMRLTTANLMRILRGYNKKMKITGIATRGREDLIDEFISKAKEIPSIMKTAIKDLDDVLSNQKDISIKPERKTAKKKDPNKGVEKEEVSKKVATAPTK